MRLLNILLCSLFIIPFSLIANKTAVIDVWSANIRKSPSIDSEPIGYAKMGENFDVIDIKDGWVKIAKNKYISENIVSIVDNKDFIELEVISRTANVRSRPTINIDTYLYELRFKDRIEAYIKLKNNWYALADGNLIHSIVVKEAEHVNEFLRHDKEKISIKNINNVKETAKVEANKALQILSKSTGIILNRQNMNINKIIKLEKEIQDLKAAFAKIQGLK